ncbi:MAG: hypothetical protein JF615_00450, partial [Asticcacaulis sp.]|nr:hypothetical protein [Asticcacaulis sp.]
AAAIVWYQKALDATVLWDMGSVAGLTIAGAHFFLHEPVAGKFDTPLSAGLTTVRVELFSDEPDALLARAVAAGAEGREIKDHDAPWGRHRQGGFTDPFGHVWHVGDRSPLAAFPIP